MGCTIYGTNGGNKWVVIGRCRHVTYGDHKKVVMVWGVGMLPMVVNGG